ncbi:MAG: VOC family protein [bacterium]
MTHSIASVAIVVRDYDEAIAFFTTCLGFVVVEDTSLGGGKRWVIIAPAGAADERGASRAPLASSAPATAGATLLLARAANAEQESRIGNQTGGRVFLFLRTDDFWRDQRAMVARGVRFVEAPREEPYGTVAVFLDLYGNKWDLVQPRAE